MSEDKFETGDRVKVSFLGEIKLGEVIEYDPIQNYYKVKGDNGRTYPCMRYLKKITEKDLTFIVGPE